MIRHIVSWKLKPGESAAREKAAAEIAEALEGLIPVIPEIIALSVSRDVSGQEKNHDVVLIADFASFDDLEAYLVHPAHIRAAGVIGPRVSARACVDVAVD